MFLLPEKEPSLFWCMVFEADSIYTRYNNTDKATHALFFMQIGEY